MEIANLLPLRRAACPNQNSNDPGRENNRIQCILHMEANFRMLKSQCSGLCRLNPWKLHKALLPFSCIVFGFLIYKSAVVARNFV
jgi:hypothetical protein